MVRTLIKDLGEHPLPQSFTLLQLSIFSSVAKEYPLRNTTVSMSELGVDVIRLCCEISLPAVYTMIQHVVAVNRGTIIAWGRWTQKTLHVPRFICVFLEEDPGMYDDTIDAYFPILCISFSIDFLSCLAIPFGVDFRNPISIGLFIVNPCCVGFAVWLGLLYAKWRLMEQLDLESAAMRYFEYQRVTRMRASSQGRAPPSKTKDGHALLA
ncbi:unnamed protein product [Clonostachys solani]|uniref:Uncharacterized protein n=1 Tax=Clonostachys solani TaxID=160281 RepID=A0A9N9Z2M0_9HYPO|nr:unnamed protein product [Clonostachys solani]